MSALPKAVRKQIEEANRLHEALSKTNVGQPAPQEVQPPVDPGSAPAAAAPAEAAAPAAAPSDGAPPAPAVEAWEQKYRVLQGKYNAEVPRLQRTVTELQDLVKETRSQLTATQNMMAALAQGRVAPGTPSTAPAAPASLVKDEEVKEFGEDLTDFIGRVAEQRVARMVDQKLQPVQQQVQQVTATAQRHEQKTAQTDQERLYAALDAQVANWREINKDDSFVAWLEQVDPFSGNARMALLRQAYEGFDVPRVVAFFNGYLKENAVVAPQPAAAPAPAEQPQRNLADFVAPGQPKASTTGAPEGAGKRVWTQAEIAKFYKDCSAGLYRSNAARRKELEEDIFAAQREGRIR